MSNEATEKPAKRGIMRRVFWALGIGQQILTFSRRQPHELVNQALRPLVEESLALLRSTLPARVSLQAVLTEAPLYLNADSSQIQRSVSTPFSRDARPPAPTTGSGGCTR